MSRPVVKSHLSHLVEVDFFEERLWCSNLFFDSGVTVPPPPSDGEVKKVADKLALFVAKNGRQFEDITRQKNPGNTPFRLLLHASLTIVSCNSSIMINGLCGAPVVCCFWMALYCLMNESLNAMVANSYECASVYSFLFDAECAEYKYYQYRVAEEEAILAPETAASQTVHAGLDFMFSVVVEHEQAVVS